MFDSLVVQWGTLLGFAALIAVLINILKLAGVVKDDTAQIWSTALNLAGLVALFLAKFSVRCGQHLAGFWFELNYNW